MKAYHPHYAPLACLGEAQDHSPRHQPWDKADGSISPRRAPGKAEKLVSHPDSFALPGLGSCMTLTHGWRRGLWSHPYNWRITGSHFCL